MLLSIIVYLGTGIGLAGAISVLVPLKFLGIRHRGTALLWFLIGSIAASAALTRQPEQSMVDSPRTRLDEFAPEWQFNEVHEIPVRATPERIYKAVLEVTPAEIPLYRGLVWIRRGFTSGPENILNPPDGDPLISVATRTTFLKLAEEPGREFVMGTVVLAPPGIRLALGKDPASFKELTQPGYAKATIGFLIEQSGNGWCRLRTETRVYATDASSSSMFARYWRVITPGSQLIRLMWLRAIKVRAEARAR